MVFKFLILLVFSCNYAFSQGASVKTFKDWKSEKIQLVSSKINAIKSRLESERLKKQKNEPAALSYYEKMLSQEQWNIDIAKELTVTDYIALYLNQIQSKSKFQDAAASLTAAEVAELMEAYTQSLQVQPPNLPTQAHQNK